jgi:DNA polymerase I-like protein with 3'-5' exonuclease and polymerase domains
VKIKRITRKFCESGETFYCIHVAGNEVACRAGDRAIRGRNCGFGFLFGMSATAFAGNTLRLEWTVKQCEKFINDFNLNDMRNTFREQEMRGLSEEDTAYLTVATYFRTEFFKIYKRLETWINDCGTLASVQGYVVSPFGARRLLPQRMYQGKDDDRAVIKNLSNIAVNSPVQDYETVFMANVMINAREKFKKYGLKSHLIGTVHDSVVGFSHVDDELIALKILLKEFMVDFPQANGIPFFGECNIADPAKGEVWGLGGKEILYEDVKDVVLPSRER